MSRPRSEDEPVSTFDVELYWPGVTLDAATALAARIRAVAAALETEGRTVRFVSAAITPRDEVCFVRLVASRPDVEAIASAAGLVDPRISEVLVVSGDAGVG